MTDEKAIATNNAGSDPRTSDDGLVTMRGDEDVRLPRKAENGKPEVLS